MGACQFHKCLIASRFIHVKRKVELERERGREGGSGGLKHHKICPEPPNLIYTTNRERRGQEKRGEGMGVGKRDGGKEKRRGRKC